MLIEIVLVILTLILLLYRFITKNFDRWEKEGIPYVKGSFPCGSYTELLTASRHLNEIVNDGYQKFKNENFHGIFMLGKPVLVVQNLDMIRNIMVKDFNHFVDRNCTSVNMWWRGGELDQIWGKTMTELTGEQWKDVRSSFSPIFTSGKMKSMLKFITEVGSSLKNEMGTKADLGVDFELREVYGKFSMDALVSCAFGFNPNSFEDKSGIFVKNASTVFTATAMENIKIALRFLPGVAKLQQMLGTNIVKPKETKYFKDIILKTIQQRRETGQRANDLIDLMLDCMKSSGNKEEPELVENDQIVQDMKFKHNKKSVELKEDMVVANCLVFLVAGYETTGVTLAFLSYYLSMHPEIQSKLQEEIDQAYDDNDGKLPEYTVIQELPYIEMCIMETLRLSSIAGVLIRSCTKDYTFPGTNVKVKFDDLVLIPVVGIHSDERYYPNPDQFNPENFSKEAKQARSPYAFHGFGQGPRGCIGMRFALLEAKVAMMEVLRNYSFVYSEKNPAVLIPDPESQVAYNKGGLHAKIVRR